MPDSSTDIRRLLAVRSEDAGAEESAPAISIETIAYWTLIAGIYLAFGFLWYFSAKEKLIDDGFAMPDGLKKAYAGSFVESFPGLDVTWALLGLVEAVAFLGVLGSLLSGEFLPSRRKPILLGALGVSVLAFGMMIFGQEIIGENEGVASLFGYFGTALVAILLVAVLPPRKGLWRAVTG